MDKLWRFIERACLVLGLLIAMATLFYTAAIYYNEAPNGAFVPSIGKFKMNAPWSVLAVGAISVALLITGWGMMLVRSDKPKIVKTDLRLQFQPNNLNPVCLDMHNIANWYAIRHEVNIQESPSKKFPQGRQHQIRSWSLYLVFERLVALKQIRIDANGAQVPVIEVKDRSPRHAVILISGDMPAAILDINIVV